MTNASITTGNGQTKDLDQTAPEGYSSVIDADPTLPMPQPVEGNAPADNSAQGPDAVYYERRMRGEALDFAFRYHCKEHGNGPDSVPMREFMNTTRRFHRWMLNGK